MGGDWPPSKGCGDKEARGEGRGALGRRGLRPAGDPNATRPRLWGWGGPRNTPLRTLKSKGGMWGMASTRPHANTHTERDRQTRTGTHARKRIQTHSTHAPGRTHHTMARRQAHEGTKGGWAGKCFHNGPCAALLSGSLPGAEAPGGGGQPTDARPPVRRGGQRPGRGGQRGPKGARGGRWGGAPTDIRDRPSVLQGGGRHSLGVGRVR